VGLDGGVEKGTTSLLSAQILRLRRKPAKHIVELSQVAADPSSGEEHLGSVSPKRKCHNDYNAGRRSAVLLS
jgi:hypothetical protein